MKSQKPQDYLVRLFLTETTWLGNCASGGWVVLDIWTSPLTGLSWETQGGVSLWPEVPLGILQGTHSCVWEMRCSDNDSLDHYFWTPGRLFNMILRCFWKEPKKVSAWVKVWSWSASTSAFPNFCFSHFTASHITEFLWGMKKLRDIYRNYSASAVQLSRAYWGWKNTEAFIKSLGLAIGLKKSYFW